MQTLILKSRAKWCINKTKEVKLLKRATLRKENKKQIKAQKQRKKRKLKKRMRMMHLFLTKRMTDTVHKHVSQLKFCFRNIVVLLLFAYVSLSWGFGVLGFWGFGVCNS